MGISNPSSPPQPVKYLFVDGAYLDSVLHKFSVLMFKGDPIEIDYDSLRASYKRVFYYHSLPGKKQGESDEDYDKRIVPVSEKLKKISRCKGYQREGSGC